MSPLHPRGVHRCGQAPEHRPHRAAAEGGETAGGLQLRGKRPAAAGSDGGRGQVRRLKNKLEYISVIPTVHISLLSGLDSVSWLQFSTVVQIKSIST